ncbi:nucleotidyltransferase domain-containing protein [Candidatus Woesearchaeota archaeon]|nr:nucleotidyltransferase domain-containing protein [Candidatus Woesearchaeota archaeon]
MEILTKQYLLLKPFIKEPWKNFTYKEIKNISKNKSDNYTYTNLIKLVENGIIKTKKIGNTVIYSLNDSIMALSTIGFLAEYEANKTKHLPHLSLQKIQNKIKTNFFILIVTGSFAKNKQTKKSDLDIVFICDNKHDPKEIIAEIRLESELTIPEIHPYVFTEEQFYQMLVNNEENYGKEIVKNNLIICGGKEYYSILKEAIKHGFNG